MARTAVTTSAFPEADNAAPSGFTDLCDGAGAIEVLGNKYHSPFGFPADYRDNGTFTNKQYFKTRLSGFTGSGNTDEIGGLLFFGADIGTGRDGYRVYVRDGATKSLIVEKVVNAGITILRTDTTQAWADSDFVEAEGDSSAGSSTTIRVFRNGTQVGTDLVDSSTPFTTGKPGLYAKQGANDSLRGDDYEAGDFTTGTPVGMATETDTALALSSPPAVGLAIETDTSHPLNGINFAQDGDLFLFGDDSGNESSMGGLKVFGGFLSSGVGLTIAQVSETDAAQSIAARQSRAIGQVAELNAAQALASPQAKAIGQVAELDSAQAIASAQARAVAQIVENDAAQAVTLGASSSALGQVVENDAAQGLASPQRKAVAQIAEADAAQGLAAMQARAIGQAAELDAATALTQRQARLIGQAQELDSATAVTGAGALQLAQQQELDAAQALAATQRLAIGQPVETDAAQPVARVLSRTVGQVVESDAAVAVGAAQRAAVGQVLEFDTALAMGAGAALSIQQIVENNAAQAVQQRLLWQIQAQQEFDALQPVSAPGYEDDPSTFYRYDVPAGSLRFDVPALSLRFEVPGQSLRFDVPSIGRSITLN